MDQDLKPPPEYQRPHLVSIHTSFTQVVCSPYEFTGSFLVSLGHDFPSCEGIISQNMRYVHIVRGELVQMTASQQYLQRI